MKYNKPEYFKEIVENYSGVHAEAKAPDNPDLPIDSVHNEDAQNDDTCVELPHDKQLITIPWKTEVSAEELVVSGGQFLLKNPFEDYSLYTDK